MFPVEVLAALAQDAAPPSGVIDYLLGAGSAGGVLAVLFLTRQIVTGADFRRVIEERNKAHAELAAIRQSVDERIIPALTRSTDLLASLEQRPPPAPRRASR